ncbi:MAG: TlyA family RNA methyltransferase [Demequinaceae bacterium]|nr:TlyA family RNA methyltransferase [Demequinaceae bacterium]
MRADRALTARGLARSRTHAQSLISSGKVLLHGLPVARASQNVEDGDSLALSDDGDRYVSRAASKLVGALDAFPGCVVAGRRCLDAGASTGGFTQVLLERGAEGVLALDVGHGQMAALLRDDPRVTAREGVNVRDLEPPTPGEFVSLVVADLSFISLTLVVGALASWLSPGGDAVLLVKPQFEVGAARLGKRGVVRDPSARAEAVTRVAEAMAEAGLDVVDVSRSVVSGADGNVEFFLWGVKSWQAGEGAAEHRPHPLDGETLRRAITREVEQSS